MGTSTLSGKRASTCESTRKPVIKVSNANDILLKVVENYIFMVCFYVSKGPRSSCSLFGLISPTLSVLKLSTFYVFHPFVPLLYPVNATTHLTASRSVCGMKTMTSSLA